MYRDTYGVSNKALIASVATVSIVSWFSKDIPGDLVALLLALPLCCLLIHPFEKLFLRFENVRLYDITINNQQDAQLQRRYYRQCFPSALAVQQLVNETLREKEP